MSFAGCRDILSGQDSNCLGGWKARSEEKTKLVPVARIAPRVFITSAYRWHRRLRFLELLSRGQRQTEEQVVI